MTLQEHLAKIRAFNRSHKRMPSYSELMAVVGFRSKNAAYKLVQRMVAEEWLDKDATGKLLPGRGFYDLPILGTVTAGFPSPAEEELADTMSLDEYLITNKEATYILKLAMVRISTLSCESNIGQKDTRVKRRNLEAMLFS
jgi:SOS-response transcriptional repressor LexA